MSEARVVRQGRSIETQTFSISEEFIVKAVTARADDCLMDAPDDDEISEVVAQLFDALEEKHFEEREDLYTVEELTLVNELETANSVNRVLNGEIVALRREKTSLADQIDDLARFILQEVAGEPSKAEGAVDTAMRVIRKLMTQNATLYIEAVALRRSNEVLRDGFPKAPTTYEDRPNYYSTPLPTQDNVRMNCGSDLAVEKNY